jgi:hypothetical protein
MKTNFIRKATVDELIPTDEYVIEKTIVLEKDLFECFIQNPLDDYEFIRENVKLMCCDNNEVFHCIFVTSDSHNFGILVESEGYHYARNAAYLSKTDKAK